MRCIDLLITASLLCGCGPMEVANASDAAVDVAPIVDAATQEATPADAVTLNNDYAQVVEILGNHCSGYCHAGGAAVGESLTFDLPDGGFADLAQIASRQVPRLRIVAAGDPDASYLMIKLEGTMHTLPECAANAAGCGIAMPWASATPMPLSASDLALIRRWIAAGAQRATQ